jgi:hypothetical protein
VSNLPNRFEVIQQLPSCETSTCICLSYKLLRCVIHTCLALAQVLANYFALRKGPNYSGMAVHYDVHIVSKQDVDKPRGACYMGCVECRVSKNRIHTSYMHRKYVFMYG